MTPAELESYLHRLVEAHVKLSVMIWGPPGIGKSSIVQQVGAKHDFDVVDLRLSQLAPTDLRGLPVPDDGVARWFPPEFLPTAGNGILLMDELNMAPPTVQGIAQQLVLDRRVGSYVLPEGWFVWAAGNRKEDRAAVFEMPAPLANRFLHLEIRPHLESFRHYALRRGISEHVVAFLAFRPELLHHNDPNSPAWPSPRTWEMADRLLAADLDPAAAIGESAAAELAAFVRLYEQMPDLDAVLAGEGEGVPFPEEPSARYAATVGLSYRVDDVEQAHEGFRWLSDRAGAEWVQLFASNIFVLMRERGEFGALAKLVQEDPSLRDFLASFREMMSST